MSAGINEKYVLPHHEQKPLCKTRLPYRQGRKLTAIKVYTINSESNHLLIFGVPALNLRQEVKSLFLKFGNLQGFHLSKDHIGELFTETYHAIYHRIQSSRMAKRMLDTKNFYGGILHVCYAPELETLNETKQKLLHRKRDVSNRLKNLKNEPAYEKEEKKQDNDESINNIPDMYGPIQNEIRDDRITPLPDDMHINNIKTHKKLNMGDNNIIYFNKKRKNTETIVENKFKPIEEKVDIIEFTSTENVTLTNINEALNYNKFGNEIIRTVASKPINQIRFNKKT